MNIRVRINHQIKAPEIRVITEDGNNLGIMTPNEALLKAKEAGLDLIEISPNANPPIAKIMDYGKFQYTEKKKQKDSKSKVQNIEIKSLQVKIATDEHDLAMKAAKASEWLKEGNRVKILLFLSGRAKFLDKNFLNERLDRILKLITEEYKIAENIQKGPKGLTIMLEKAKK